MVWRIDVGSNTGVLTMPTIVGTPGYFQPGNLSVIPTQVDWGWLNRVQEEQANLVLAAGQSLNPTLYNQMATSVSIIASNAGYTLTGTKVTSALGYTPVNKAGDAMTGNLTVGNTPTSGSYNYLQVYNIATIANTLAEMAVVTGTTNSYGIIQVVESGSGTSQLNIIAGAACSQGVVIQTGGTNQPFYVNQGSSTRLSFDASGNLNVFGTSATFTGALTAGNGITSWGITNTGVVNTQQLGISAGVTNANWQNQGGYIGWNATGSSGETDFYSSKGGGVGGFNFYNVASNATATPTLLVSISASGTLTANAINASAITTGLGFTPVNKAGDTMTAPLFVGSGVGSVSLNQGGSLNTGFIAFFNATGVRQGYIGYGTSGSNINLETEGSATGYTVTSNLYVEQAFGVGGAATLDAGVQIWNGATISSGGVYVAGSLDVGGTTTLASGVQIWNGATILSGVLTAGSASFTSATITGVTNASNAATGQVGEFISATISAASQVALTSSVPTNITSISLSAGDWDIWGNIGSSVAGTTVTIWMYGAISTTSSTIPAQPNNGGSGLSGAMPAGATSVVNVGRMRLNVSTTTVVYLVADMNFTTSTAAAVGFIGARRVR